MRFFHVLGGIVIYSVFFFKLNAQCFKYEVQPTVNVSLGNVRSFQSRNTGEFSFSKETHFKNTLRGSYIYSDLNRKKNKDEIYLGNFSKFYFKTNLRFLVVGETESSFMRGILNRTNLGAGLGIDTKKKWDFSNVIFIETIKWSSREAQIIRNSFRVETEHNLAENIFFKTRIFLQPDLALKYSRASGTASLSMKIKKSLELTWVINISWEQWVPAGRKNEDLAFSLGVTYKK
jgi:hypothetical protein